MCEIRYEVKRERPLSSLCRSAGTVNGLTCTAICTRCRYTPECSKLLAQYKTTLKLLGDEVPSLDAFVSEYRVCLALPADHCLLSLCLAPHRIDSHS